MVNRNSNIASLESGYLFPEIRKRKEAFLKENPHAKIISLGVGDTTEPITPFIGEGLEKAAAEFRTRAGYKGYPPETGDHRLRTLIAEKVYQGKVNADDIFISDGSKCDVGRLQIMFGCDVTIGVQDPVYPVYVDTSRILGQKKIVPMPCLAENNFFPTSLPETDLIFFCSPNNPTGAVATKDQLKRLVAHAKQNKSIIIFDAAYSAYIQDPELPKSIYEIPGAEEVAIEMSSFSKSAGFTGLRLGWTVVPEALKFDDGWSVKRDWHRIMTTFFNGASHISSAGGINALSDNGLREINQTVAFYLENAKIISKALEEVGFTVYSGKHVPYLWVSKSGFGSWELFEFLLHEAHLLTVPGRGFGPSGEGFVRVSAFAQREVAIEAAKRLKEVFNVQGRKHSK